MSNSTKRKMAQDYLNLGVEMNLVWVEENPVPNTHTKTKWQCSNQPPHVFESTYSDVRGRHGCPYCAGRAKRTHQDYLDLAQSLNYKLIGDVPKNTGIKTSWLCSQNHTFLSSFSNLLGKHGCPICKGIAIGNRCRNSPEKYHKLAQKRGYQWIGDYPTSNRIPTTWVCEFGHSFEMPFHDVQGGHGCSICAGFTRKIAIDYHNLASSKGYSWIETEIENATSKSTWVCSKGHKFISTYAYIQSGRGCPACQDRVNGQPVSKAQRRLHEKIGGVLNHRVNRLVVDIALDTDTPYPIAVEYDCWYWHKDNLEHDAKKSQQLIDSGWKVLRIKTRSHVPKKEIVEAAINHLRTTSETYLEIVLSDWNGGKLL